MVSFESITTDTLEVALTIVNSNPTYNRLENGRTTRSLEEITEDFLDPKTVSLLVKLENKPIGIIDFLKENPNDHAPWLGLFMIHGDYQSLGYGRKVYDSFEEKLNEYGLKHVRLGVLQQNESARRFWETLGFKLYKESLWEGKAIYCFEKSII